jgi:hypothetical protein
LSIFFEKIYPGNFLRGLAPSHLSADVFDFADTLAIPSLPFKERIQSDLVDGKTLLTPRLSLNPYSVHIEISFRFVPLLYHFFLKSQELFLKLEQKFSPKSQELFRKDYSTNQAYSKHP